MGQLDGTNDISTSPTARGGQVWVDDDQPSWMTGGSYLVVRRVRMLLERWEDATPETQDRALGRHSSTSAPLGGCPTSATRAAASSRCSSAWPSATR